MTTIDLNNRYEVLLDRTTRQMYIVEVLSGSSSIYSLYGFFNYTFETNYDNIRSLIANQVSLEIPLKIRECLENRKNQHFVETYYNTIASEIIY